MADDWRNMDDFLHAKRVRIGAPTPGQTTGGVHTPTSLHYKALARDYGDANSDCRGVVRELAPFARGKDYRIVELFYTPLNVFFKRGVAIRPDASLRTLHRNHVHAALRAGYKLPIPATISQPLTPPTISEASKMINKPAVAILPSKSGNGYAIVAADGAVYALGDFPFYGSMGGKTLNAPIVDAAVHPSGEGYWLLAADGGLFCFGKAPFYTTPDGKSGTDFIE